jgi:hypothetical protein
MISTNIGFILRRWSPQLSKEQSLKFNSVEWKSERTYTVKWEDGICRYYFLYIPNCFILN